MVAREPTQTGLSRRRLGVIHLVFFTVAASAPLTVLGGGVTTTIAVTGSTGIPLSFIVLALVLGLFSVGYAAMSRHVSNAGAFYSYLANGLRREWGVSGSFVALIAYNTIQIALYGLFGFGLGQFVAAKFGLNLPWWAWALAALVLVGALGVLRIDLNAMVLAVLLTCECIAVAIYDVSALMHPVGGALTTTGWQPSHLFVPGVGAVLAFGIAAFTGFESGATYSEECRDPRRTVARATFVAICFTGLFYALSAWAMTQTAGPDDLRQQAADPVNGGPGVVFGYLASNVHPVVADIANVLFLTSVMAALLSFHNGVARYLFALGRERVLPPALGRVGARSGGPVAGSLAQSILALVVVATFVVAGADPVLQLFTWLSGMSAVGVVLLMALTSISVIGYFRRDHADTGVWERAIAPTLAFVSLVVLVVLLVANFNSLLGTDPTSLLRYILPGIVLAIGLIGLVWGLVIRAAKPDIYAGIGRATAEPVIEPAEHDHGLEIPASLRS